MRILDYRSSASNRWARRRLKWRIVNYGFGAIVCLALVLFFGYWVFLAGFDWIVHGDRMMAPVCLGLIVVCAVFLGRSIYDGYQVIEARRSLRELR